MAHIHADGVADTTTSTGTGNITAANAAPTGFRTFNDVATDGDTFFYFIRHRTSQEWEAGLGTYAGSHEFARSAIVASSNSNNAVDFTAGTKDVFISAIAGRDNPRLHGVPSDNAMARFDGTTGNLQSSPLVIDDGGNASGLATIELGDASDTTIARSAAGVVSVEGVNLLSAGIEDQSISGGARVTSKSLSTGSITIDPGDRPLQYITNGGAFTITAPSNDGSCILLVTNDGSAGAISFSGFQVGDNVGDDLTTVNGDDFKIYISRINGISSYSIQALQ